MKSQFKTSLIENRKRGRIVTMTDHIVIRTLTECQLNFNFCRKLEKHPIILRVLSNGHSHAVLQLEDKSLTILTD